MGVTAGRTYLPMTTLAHGELTVPVMQHRQYGTRDADRAQSSDGFDIVSLSVQGRAGKREQVGVLIGAAGKRVHQIGSAPLGEEVPVGGCCGGGRCHHLDRA